MNFQTIKFFCRYNLLNSKKDLINAFPTVIKELKFVLNVVDSRCFPLSSAVLVTKLKKHYCAPWIIYLSDPWIAHDIAESDEIQREAKSLYIADAEVVCLTTERTIETYYERYLEHKHKLFLFPNPFDSEKIRSAATTNVSKLRFVHTGGLAGQRNPSFFLKVLDYIHSFDDSLSENLKIGFAGHADRQSRKACEWTTHGRVECMVSPPIEEHFSYRRQRTFSCAWKCL